MAEHTPTRDIPRISESQAASCTLWEWYARSFRPLVTLSSQHFIVRTQSGSSVRASTAPTDEEADSVGRVGHGARKRRKICERQRRGIVNVFAKREPKCAPLQGAGLVPCQPRVPMLASGSDSSLCANVRRGARLSSVSCVRSAEAMLLCECHHMVYCGPLSNVVSSVGWLSPYIVCKGISG